MNEKNSFGLDICFGEKNNPFELFKEWFDEAKKTELNDPNAVALGTSDDHGYTSVRMVLLKDFNETGFVFYTNFNSAKGLAIKKNPNISMCFHWKSLLRQIRIEGAAGGIAKQILKFILGKKYDVVGGVTQLGILGSNPKNWNEKFIKKNQLFCPDKSVLELWEKYLLGIRKAGSSCGAIIEIRAKGVPVGLGAPIYSKLDMDLASAMMSINAVKGVNIGSGMNSAQLTGEENSDEINQRGKSTKFNSNNAGGILGGISSGQDVIVSFAVKPTSSILSTRKTIDKFGKNTTISVKGRHDPCVGIRAVPIGEAMMHCVILDHYLLNKAQCGN